MCLVGCHIRPHSSVTRMVRKKLGFLFATLESTSPSRAAGGSLLMWRGVEKEKRGLSQLQTWVVVPMCWGHRTQQSGALGGGRWVAKVRESYKQPSRTRAFYHPKSQGWFSSLFLFLWPQELACHLRRISQMPSSPPTEGHSGTLPVCCSSRLM